MNPEEVDEAPYLFFQTGDLSAGRKEGKEGGEKIRKEKLGRNQERIESKRH